MNTRRAPGLGRGLEALIPLPESREGALVELVSVDEIRPSPHQVRRRFDADALRELADSIRAQGVLQPVLVQRTMHGFELIAGERRWRAARQAGLSRIPAIVRREVAAESSLVLGLIENLQRADLDPIEEARGLHQLIEEFGLTQEEAAERLGKNRVSIAQALRLLQACPAVQSAISSGAISAGHGRALVSLPTPAAQEHGLRVVLGRRLSVRQTETWVGSYSEKPRRRRVSSELALLATDLEARLSLPVTVSGRVGRGRVTVHFRSQEELSALREKLGV
jgi:ParB family transcriptional regulator, chromosome partitioning protein